MASSEHSVELAGVNLAGRNHVCAFFNTIDEEHRVLGSFYKDGFDRGEKATHIVDSENREGYLNRLAEAGINVQEMMETGQLEVLPWTDMYVRDRRFDQDAMLASVELSVGYFGRTHSSFLPTSSSMRCVRRSAR